MTRNLSAHPSQLLNPTISKFLLFLLHSYDTLQHIEKIHVVPAISFSSHNIKVLPTHQLDFFGLVIPLNFFLEIGRNYVSIIITTIGNITVCHSVNKNAPPVISPTPLPYQVFTRLVCCFTRNIYHLFFALVRLFQKIIQF